MPKAVRPRRLAAGGSLAAALLAFGGCGRAGEAPPPPAAAAATPAAEAPGRVEPARTRSSPDDPRIEEARRLLRASRFDLAASILEQVLEEQPDSARARFFLGVSLGKQQRYAAASGLFREVLESDFTFPERPHVDHFHGWALYYLGEAEAARASFARHLESSPREGDSAFGLGLISLDADDLAEAERWFRLAIELQQGEPGLAPEVAKAEARMGDLRARQDRLEEAIEWWARCTARHADHHEAWHKLARAYARLGQAAESEFAARQWQAALARLGRPIADAGMGPQWPSLESPDAP